MRLAYGVPGIKTVMVRDSGSPTILPIQWQWQCGVRLAWAYTMQQTYIPRSLLIHNTKLQSTEISQYSNFLLIQSRY